MSFTSDLVQRQLNESITKKNISAVWETHGVVVFTEKYYSLGLLVVGTIGNLLCLAVLSRRTFRQTSVGIYLRFLTLSDLMALYTGVLYFTARAMFDLDFRKVNELSCKFHRWLSFAACDLSSWALVLVSIDRLISIAWPMKRLNTRCRVYVSLLVTVIVLLATNLPIFIIYGDVHDVAKNKTKVCVITQESYTDFYNHVFSWIVLLKFSFLPFVLLIILNTALIISVYRSNKAISDIQNGSARGSLMAATNMKLRFSRWRQQFSEYRSGQDKMETGSDVYKEVEPTNDSPAGLTGNSLLDRKLCLRPFARFLVHLKVVQRLRIGKLSTSKLVLQESSSEIAMSEVKVEQTLNGCLDGSHGGSLPSLATTMDINGLDTGRSTKLKGNHICNDGPGPGLHRPNHDPEAPDLEGPNPVGPSREGPRTCPADTDESSSDGPNVPSLEDLTHKEVAGGCQETSCDVSPINFTFQLSANPSHKKNSSALKSSLEEEISSLAHSTSHHTNHTTHNVHDLHLDNNTGSNFCDAGTCPPDVHLVDDLDTVSTNQNVCLSEPEASLNTTNCCRDVDSSFNNDNHSMTSSLIPDLTELNMDSSSDNTAPVITDIPSDFSSDNTTPVISNITTDSSSDNTAPSNAEEKKSEFSFLVKLASRSRRKTTGECKTEDADRPVVPGSGRRKASTISENGGRSHPTSVKKQTKSRQPVSSSNSRSKSLTITLLVLNTVFLMCTTPITVYMTGKTYFWPNDKSQYIASQDIASTMANFCMYTNNAINFILYCVTGSKFRGELVLMFKELYQIVRRGCGGSRS